MLRNGSMANISITTLIINMSLSTRRFPCTLLGYNQKLVDPKTLTSYGDLLDPKWKGKITLKDPKSPAAKAHCFSCSITRSSARTILKNFSASPVRRSCAMTGNKPTGWPPVNFRSP